MKRLKIFLASSIREFKDERNKIGDAIRKKQDMLIDEDIRLNLFECEFAPNAIVNGRMQEVVYNTELRKSDVFIMLLGEKAGEYTLEEYEISKEVENIKRYILFKNCISNNTIYECKERINDDIKKGLISTVIEFKDNEELIRIIDNIIDENI